MKPASCRPIRPSQAPILHAALAFLLAFSPVFAQISPVLDRVEQKCDGSYSAVFGYRNPGDSTQLPAGAENKFTPSPLDRGQPGLFLPGSQGAAVTIPFDGSNLVWSLNGRTATANSRLATVVCSDFLKVSPILEKVETLPGGLFRAHFGYSNPNPFAITLPLGSLNKFHYQGRQILDMGQTLVFQTGRQRSVFALDFDGTHLVWTLNGKTSTAAAPKNPTPPPPPPLLLVKIIQPANGALFNQFPIPIAWTVGGVLQDSGREQALLEGSNRVVRSFTDSLNRTVSDSITVFLDTQAPHVEIVEPARDTTVRQARIRIRYRIDEQLGERVFDLASGPNILVIDSTDSAGNRGADTVRVTYIPLSIPVVRILEPVDSFYTSKTPISIRYTVNDSPFTKSINLVEGANEVKVDTLGPDGRGADSILIFLDRSAPVVRFLSPADFAMVLERQALIRWSVDGVEQTPYYHTLDTTQRNYLEKVYTDRAGNTGRAALNLYAGVRVPNILGRPLAEAEALLQAKTLFPDTSWKEDGAPTGTVLTQQPAAGDTTPYGFRVRVSLSKGPDAVDMKPVQVDASTLTYGSLDLKVEGTVTAKVVNLGRAAAGPYRILFFEDRNRDGKYAPGIDNSLGVTEAVAGHGPRDTWAVELQVQDTLLFANNRIHAWVDAGEAVAETNEGNNTLHSMADCVMRPDSVSYDLKVKWEWGDPEFSSMPQSPIVISITDDNGDGRSDEKDVPDVVFIADAGRDCRDEFKSTVCNRIVVLDGKTGKTHWFRDLGLDRQWKIVGGDLDGDGKVEIVAIQNWHRVGSPFNMQRIVILNGQGSIKDTSDWTNEGTWTHPRTGLSIADLNGDGKSEILFGRKIYDYRAIKINEIAFPHSGLKQSLIHDINDDGFQEIIWPQFEKWTWFDARKNIVTNNYLFNGSLGMVADINKDGGAEFLFPTNADRLFEDKIGDYFVSNFINATVDTLFGISNQYNKQGVYDVAFFEHEDVPYAVSLWAVHSIVPGTNFALGGPSVSIRNLINGEVKNKNLGFGHGNFEMTLFDFDNYDGPEIVIRSTDTLYLLNMHLDVMLKSKIVGGSYSSPIVADIDNDHHADLLVNTRWSVVSRNASLTAYSNPTWAGARSIWNQANYSVTNINDDGSIPRFPVPNWRAQNTFNVQANVDSYCCLDLSASYPRIGKAAPAQGGGTTLTFRIGNSGALLIRQGLRVALYDGEPGPASRILLDTFRLAQDLYPGDYVDLQKTFGPGFRGLRQVVVVADDSGNGQGEWAEVNEVNNRLVFTYNFNNASPALALIPDQNAEPGQVFAYTALATDEDGDSLTFGLGRAPQGMSIHPRSGLLTFTPPAGLKRCTVQVEVRDPFGARDAQSFLLFVGALTNRKPRIVSAPPLHAVTNAFSPPSPVTYRYPIQVEDEDGEALEYFLRTEAGKPTTLLPWIDFNTGLLRFFPIKPDWSAGDSLRLFITVRDERGGLDSQSYTLKIIDSDAPAPPFFATRPDTSAVEGESWIYAPQAVDFAGRGIRYVLKTAPAGMTVRNDTVSFTPPFDSPPRVPVSLAAVAGPDTVIQHFTLSIANVNDLPAFTSRPESLFVRGEAYRYALSAVDPDGDSLRFTLLSAPAGMSLSAAGLLEWPASPARPESAQVRVQADDGRGGLRIQAWTVRRRKNTVPPSIILALSASPVYVGETVTAQIQAEDDEAVDSLALWVDGGAVFLAPNAIAYTFTATRLGSLSIRAMAFDADRNSDTAEVLLQVLPLPGDSPESLKVTALPESGSVGDTFVFRLSRPRGFDSASIRLEVAGETVALRNGEGRFRAFLPGLFRAVARGYDSLGILRRDSAAFRVSAPSESLPAPVAELLSPSEDEEIRGKMEVRGTAANLSFYTLSYQERGSASAPPGSVAGAAPLLEFHRSEAAVNNGVLGYFDAALVDNGLYRIVLTVYNRAGEAVSAEVPVQVLGAKKLGPFTLSFTDLTLSTFGPALAVERHYDSRRKAKGDFGIGWTLGLRSLKLFENRNQGADWSLDRAPGAIARYSLSATKRHTVTITIPGGRTQEFEAEARLFNVLDPSFGEMVYVPKPGTYSRLENLDGGNFVVQGGQLYAENGSFDEPYNPARYKLTLTDGSSYLFDETQGGMVSYTDANGNSLSLEGDRIRHSSGRQIDFVRDGQGRITRIADAAGRQVDYAYDAEGNLRSVTDPEGQITRFRYAADSYLEEILDARGIRALRSEYDSLGRLVRQINAEGDTLSHRFDAAANRVSVEDFGGDLTAFDYDERGNVLQKTDALGHVTQYAYDSLDNLIRTRNALGGVRTAVFDARGHELSSTDELGRTTTRTFSPFGKVLTETDPLGRTRTFEYDGSGNLTVEKGPDGQALSRKRYDTKGRLTEDEDALGAKTLYAHDAEGHVMLQVGPRGDSSHYAYDAAGNRIEERDALGRISKQAYDRNNRLLYTVNALGDTVRTEYDAIGKPLRERDARGFVTVHEYDPFGQKVLTRRADSSVLRTAYDAEGQVVEETDPLGRKTSMVYDAEGRLLETRYADGAVVKSEYDALGRRVAAIDARGNRTEYGYDAVGNNVSVKDALGFVTRYEYDATGRKISMTDALGRTTRYEYDSEDRLVKTLLPDGSFTEVEFDAAGRKVAEADGEGRGSLFLYDAAGNLTGVVNALGDTTSYSYDLVGNRLAQKDALGRTTVLAYDALNRQIAKTYPGGDAERWGYDANGNRVYQVDGEGDSTIYRYDAMNRETHRRYAGGHAVATAYRADGQKESVTDHRGITRYAYDPRGRLKRTENPDGSFVESGYDLAGNRTLQKLASGETRYGYDALSRMSTVTSPDGAVTRYFYNAVGNRDSASLGNGLSTAYRYDALNRLQQVTHYAGGGAVLSSHAYTLNKAGIRTQVLEADGSRVVYGYDPLYRLTSEERTGNHPYANSFTYDKVGNRLSQVKNGALTSYAYNARDQLLREEKPDTLTLYTYDRAGRQKTKSVNGQVTHYGWADEDRLVSVTGPGVPGVGIRFTYDAAGFKVAESGSGLSGTPSETPAKTYVYDFSLPYGQVVEERSGVGAGPGVGAGTVTASYVYGLERISQERAGQAHWYLADGQGSIRALSDAAGTLTDTYTYSAFGEEVARTGSTENPFRYVGEEWSPNSGFYYLRARWMDPSGGRFVSVDPFGGDPQSPMSLHRYLYAGASPMNYFDPTGKFFLSYVNLSFELQLRTQFSLVSAIANTSRIAHTKIVNELLIEPITRAIERDLMHFELEEAGYLYYEHRKQLSLATKFLRAGFGMIDFAESSANLIRQSNGFIQSFIFSGGGFGSAPTTVRSSYYLKTIELIDDTEISIDKIVDLFRTGQ